MWRTLLAATLVYVYGHPALNHVRPGFLDKPLEGFHADVNLAAQEGQHALAMLGDARAMHYVGTYVALVSSKFHWSK
jgi:hypothetical protein